MNTVLNPNDLDVVWSKWMKRTPKSIDNFMDAIAESQDAHTRSELARLVREMIIKDPHYKSQMEVNEALQAVLKVLEGTK